jgi:hypothetical protein
MWAVQGLKPVPPRWGVYTEEQTPPPGATPMTTNTSPRQGPQLLTKHAGATGTRVNVLKPSLRARTDGNRHQDWTAVYVSARALAVLLPLAGGNIAAVNDAVRNAALTARKTATTSFSRACVAGARQLLEQADAAGASAAAANNEAWA